MGQNGDPDFLSLTVVILTFNEEVHIERAIASVSAIARRIVVVDSGSTDRTAELARAGGAEVLVHPFLNYAAQFQWALDHAAIDTDWVMRLDADEVVEPGMRDEIAERLEQLAPSIVGVIFARKHIFMGRWIRHGARYPLLLLRIWRRGHGRIEQRWMDEHMVTWGGDTVTFRSSFCDINERGLGFFTAKHNGYATREVLDILSRRLLPSAVDEDLGKASSAQASARRWIKERVYNRLPLGVGPLGYFLYRYILRLGFLDGRAGVVYHALQGFWYRFLVDAKRWELERAIADCRTDDERIDRLHALTGHDLRAMARLSASA